MNKTEKRKAKRQENKQGKLVEFDMNKYEPVIGLRVTLRRIPGIIRATGRVIDNSTKYVTVKLAEGSIIKRHIIKHNVVYVKGKK